MSKHLPVIESPRYTALLPSTGQKITFRPFLVQEEKVLLMAIEADDDYQMLRAVKDVISSCTFGKVDPEKLTLFDLEFLLLRLRAKSVGETAKISIKCEKCGKPTDVEVDLEGITTSAQPKIGSEKIKLTDKIGVVMRWPTVSQVDPSEVKIDSVDSTISIIAGCIESVWDQDGVYPSEDYESDQLKSFVLSLNREQFGKMQDYVAGMPTLKHVAKFKCVHCQTDNELTVTGLKSFFGSASPTTT